ncbi:MAG: hypothetical protein H9847_09180 [Candidatus Anaerobiospirillum pullicola]|uniref:Uncharacterized protein n=1 Tax=Candidatus Anaerobiospirillum pullicola TaxID=2838451 RepID=A0A948TI45_9GAMM|nr:hypothetical protein [Candidatus Anaerobiospirillum pullicola]
MGITCQTFRNWLRDALATGNFDDRRHISKHKGTDHYNAFSAEDRALICQLFTAKGEFPESILARYHRYVAEGDPRIKFSLSTVYRILSA